MSSVDFRLQTPTGIPYKIVSLSGSFAEEGASCVGVYLIESANLLPFVEEGLPSAYTGRARFPGLDTLSCQKISFKAHDESRPIDPFGIDSGAPENTYGELVEVTVDFAPMPNNDGDPTSSDPETFLEISCNGAGEFLYTPSRGKSKWENGDENTDIDVPSTVMQPELEWNCRWSQIPNTFFKNTLLTRLRDRLGTVNEDTMTLFNAPQETMLFVGFSMRQQFTWRAGFNAAPPIQLEIKFLEKYVTDGAGKRVGHNHFYRPGGQNGGSWQKLLVDGVNKVYKLTDFNTIFDV